MKRSSILMVMLVGAWIQTGRAWAGGPPVSLYSSPAPDQQTKYRTPEDLLDKVPFLGDIPRTFLLGDGFKMKLSAQELRIDHMGYKSHSPASQRQCMIGLSYMTPVAGFFTSRVDLPLFHAPALSSQWAMSSLGDYVTYFSRGASDHASVRLVASARF